MILTNFLVSQYKYDGNGRNPGYMDVYGCEISVLGPREGHGRGKMENFSSTVFFFF